jgi:PAS domain-containing protein
LIQNSPDIITVVDAKGTVLYQSPAMKRALGYEPEDRIGKNGVEAGLLHPDDFPARNEAFEKASVIQTFPLSLRSACGIATALGVMWKRPLLICSPIRTCMA